MDNVYVILATIILIILIITVLYRKDFIVNSNINKNVNGNLNLKEGFAGYMDVRNKTMNWCNKLRDAGIMNQQQYEECVNRFKENTSGILPKEFTTPENGMAQEYSLYNVKETSLTSNITGGTTNNIILASPTGLFMVCNPDNTVSFVNNINDPSVNQTGLNFTLAPQSDDVYAILSPYGKYLTATDTLTAEFISTSIGNSSSWKATRLDNNKIIFESVFYKGFYLTFMEQDYSLSVVFGQNESMNWTIVVREVVTGDGDAAEVYNGEEYIARKESLLNEYENILNNKVVLDEINKGLEDLKTKITNNMNMALTHLESVSNAKIAQANNTIQTTPQITEQSTSPQSTSPQSTTPQATSQIDYSTLEAGDLEDEESGNNTVINEAELEKSVLTFNNSNVNNAKNDITTALNSFTDQIAANKNDFALKLDKVSKVDLENIEKDYEALLEELDLDLQETNTRIESNKVIMTRIQKDVNLLDNKLTDMTVKMDKYKVKDTTSKLNIDLVNQQNASNTYKIMIYKVSKFIIGLIVIYLTYSAALKFKANVYDKYL